jgi:subtilisin family serine protease
MISIFGADDRTSSAAIREAADNLSAGDILLIELHYPGPKNNYAERNDQDGYIAVEWWPDEFVAIQYAVGRGVIVVEAAGNGAQNLDDALYENRHPGFPPNWKNPFRRSNRDSGAILIGAGAPPPGTHNRNLFGPNLSRLDFSNYGSAVDAQGWGREVTTCGYGDLQGGADEDRWYTDKFSGTSSASPIIVGALACLQGIRRARGAPLLTPASARALLRATGSPQQPGPNAPVAQRIGNRPDLKALVAALDTIS